MKSTLLNTDQLIFLVGIQVEQVCVGEFQIILCLSDDVSISIETVILQEAIDGSQLSVWSPSDIRKPFFIQRVLGSTITDERVCGDRTLLLSFSNGDKFTVTKRLDGLESYQITKPQACFIV